MSNKLWAPIVFIGIVFTGVVAIGAAAVKAEEANAGKQLVDVVSGTMFDGWGRASVETLSIYYSADRSTGDVEMLGYRAGFLPVFDWAKGMIGDAAASDLYNFYASGAGAGRVQSASDPSYAFGYVARYREPQGRVNLAAGAG